MKRYDVILAGGGASGLSLALELCRSPLRGQSILIVDREEKKHNDRTWCFWTRTPEQFSGLAHRTWNRLRFSSPGFEACFSLEPYDYQMVRGSDYYAYAKETLAACPGVAFLTAPVERIEDGPEHASVFTPGAEHQATWVFNSLYSLQTFHPDTRRFHYLKQHFLGWLIETAYDVFDPGVPVLFDFRTPQLGAMRFFYVLPFSSRRALVEYTLFSPAVLPEAEYRLALQEYCQRILGAGRFTLLDEERGVIPMTDQPLARRTGRRIVHIGTLGGRVKPSSGYAFLRIQHDSQAITRSLVEHGVPYFFPHTPARYARYDALMLDVMQHSGDAMQLIFTHLFRRNPIQRIFRFLDEESSFAEDLRLIASLPPLPFLQAWLRTKWLRREN
ncbi:MAG: Lycopene cyclase [Chloroflexi bacterium]|nr:Lycopene cyclase [Chloroflexota bacterium]